MEDFKDKTDDGKKRKDLGWRLGWQRCYVDSFT